MRSVDQIRERVLSRLADAYAADALSVLTLERRASVALAARTRDELAGCVWDLPAGRPRHRRGDPARPLRLIVETEPPVTIAWPPEARSLVIGRGSGGDLGVTDLTVSRRHAELSRRGGRLRVRDLGSLNGTTVNGRPVEVASLRRGDVLTLGALAIRVR
jgi:FHA domain/DUF1707 SHOCT-like domain